MEDATKGNLEKKNKTKNQQQKNRPTTTYVHPYLVHYLQKKNALQPFIWKETYSTVLEALK